jgi:UDP-N-acetylmuramoyl-L-alanyl-D-glutamate--2,6-diaminopimelate ligase
MAATLSEVAAAAPGVRACIGDAVVTDVTHDSRSVGPGSLFVAIRGATTDGHRFLDQAVASGASAIAVDTPIDLDIPTIIVTDTRWAMASMARTVHGAPDRDLTILGITGTNGKTTVVHLCEAVWRQRGASSGILGTLGARYGDTPIDLGHTTPESSDLQRVLAGMRDDGIREVAMEVSSHALALHRVDDVAFAAVGFTNLTQDHLDFHGTMEAYFTAKASLFDPARTRHAVVNVDDEHGRRLVGNVPSTTTVSIGGSADLVALDLELTPRGSTFVVRGDGAPKRFEIPIAGAFNVSNALVATGLLRAIGEPMDTISSGMATLAPIPGRMEVVPHDGDFSVVVDYAHTPDAVTSVLSSTRRSAPGRVIAVLGAGGDRDQDKRALMGAAAARFADLTVVTTDNPRSEDAGVIASEVARGAEVGGRSDVRTILDRRAAMEWAIDAAQTGDVVMILGRGHERDQDFGDEVIPFRDADVAAEILGQRTPS